MDKRLKSPWQGLDKDFHLRNVVKGSALWYQVAVLVRIRAETTANSVHEVGPGRGINGILLKHIGFEYGTLSDLPSQQGLPAPLLQSATETEVADIVCAYQVLEHNSLRSFGELIGKLGQLSRRFVVISLPVANPYLRLEIEPKFFSGYATKSRTRIARTFYFPRWLAPRPKHPRIRDITGTTQLADTTDEFGNEVMASRSHLWEVGERGAKLSSLASMAQNQALRLQRASYAPFFPKQVFLEFERELTSDQIAGS